MKSRNFPGSAAKKRAGRILMTVIPLGMTVFLICLILRVPALRRIDLIRGNHETVSHAVLRPGETWEQTVYVYRDFEQIVLYREDAGDAAEADVRIFQNCGTVCSERIAFVPGQTEYELAVSGCRGTMLVQLSNSGSVPLTLPLTDSAEYDPDYLTSSRAPLLRLRVSHFSDSVPLALILAVLLLCAVSLAAAAGYGGRWTRGRAVAFLLIVCAAYLILFPAWNINDFSAHFSTAYAFSSKALGIPPVDEYNQLMVREEDEYYFRYVLTEPYSLFYQPSRRSYDDSMSFLFQSSGRNQPVPTRYAPQPLDGYGFWNYLPCVLGLAAARLLSLNLVTAVFLARLFSVALYAAGIWFALRKLPENMAVPVTVLSVLPLCAMNLTAVSYDPLCYVLVLLLFACVLSLRKRAARGDVISLALCSAALGMVKGGAYALLLLSAMLLLSGKDRPQRRAAALAALAGVLGLLFNYRHLLLGTGRYFQFGHDGWTTYTPGWAFLHPGEYLLMMVRTYHREAAQIALISQRLGWNHPVLPWFVCVLYYGLIFCSFACSDLSRETDRPFSRAEKGWILLPIVLMILLTPVMMLSSTEIGSETITGMQGRYFLPLFIPVSVLICHRKRRGASPRLLRPAFWLWGAGVLSLGSVYYIMSAFLF